MTRFVLAIHSPETHDGLQSIAMSSAVTLSNAPTQELSPALERLHPNARLSSMIGSGIVFGLLAVVGAIVELILTRGSKHWPWPTYIPLISLVAGTVVTLGGLLLAYLQFARFGYQLREHDLVIVSGVIWRTRRCVPRARIQHVDIDSGPIDRGLGLVQVRLYVAGGLGAVAELPGVSPLAADELKEALVVAPTDGV